MIGMGVLRGTVHAIDEVERLKTDGYLTYCRFPCRTASPEQHVVESVAVSLRTPTDPLGQVVEEITVEWISDPFNDELLSPRLNAGGGSLKMLALFPEIFAPFFNMRSGRLSADDFVYGLARFGVQLAR